MLHFAEDGDSSGFFPQLAKHHDRSRYRMLFGTLRPTVHWLRSYMESHDVRCFSCESRGRWDYPLALLRLTRFLRRERVDIVHAHLYEPSLVGLSAALMARTPVRVMTRHHSDYHSRVDRHLHVFLDRLCTTLSHAVIAVSSHTADQLVRVEHAPAAKVHVVLNGIDFDRVKPGDPASRDKLRDELGVRDGYLLLTAARMHPEKGYEHLLSAMAEIRRRLDRPCLLGIAGTGPLEAHYRELAESLGVSDCVRFLGFRNDLPDLMLAADLFVLASVAEAFGLVIAEALYLGVPVVATRAGGIPEIVDDGRDGLLVPPGNSAALAAAVVSLLSDPGRRRSMATSGRDKIASRFRFDAMVRQYESLYDRLPSTR